jgi:SAM-dependent methyltransferase
MLNCKPQRPGEAINSHEETGRILRAVAPSGPLGLPLVRAEDPAAGPALAILAGRLAEFYSSDSKYFDFAGKSDHSRFYESLKPHLSELAAKRAPRRVRLLELGAGRTSFPAWLESVGLRTVVEFVAQDITALNREWLTARCDDVLICDAADGLAGGPYDLVFSTFVYEHLIRPAQVVEASLATLAPGGLLAIFSPHYVLPGYVPPAMRAMPLAKRWAATLLLAWQKWWAAWRRRPNFWIVTEPALFVRGYFMDADAVHLVSEADLRILLGSRVDPLPLNFPAKSLRDWVWSRFILLAVLYRKR